MARKSFNTTIEEEISTKFKEACNASGIGMNIVVESFMTAFIQNKVVLTLKDGKMILKMKDD